MKLTRRALLGKLPFGIAGAWVAVKSTWAHREVLSQIDTDDMLLGKDAPDTVRKHETEGGMYVALYTVAPTEEGGGTEVTGGGYARARVTDGNTIFPTATECWGAVVAYGLIGTAIGGNLLYYWADPAINKTVCIDDTVWCSTDDIAASWDTSQGMIA